MAYRPCMLEAPGTPLLPWHTPFWRRPAAHPRHPSAAVRIATYCPCRGRGVVQTCLGSKFMVKSEIFWDRCATGRRSCGVKDAHRRPGMRIEVSQPLGTRGRSDLVTLSGSSTCTKLGCGWSRPWATWVKRSPSVLLGNDILGLVEFGPSFGGVPSRQHGAPRDRPCPSCCSPCRLTAARSAGHTQVLEGRAAWV